MDIAEFNRLSPAGARSLLLPCVDICRWADTVADARPFADVDEALQAARIAADPWTDVELDGALTHHPRIGDRASGSSAEAALSRSEQAAVDPDDGEVAAALEDGNRRYEDKFGHVFLIRAAGRSPTEILTALEARLSNTEEQERRVMAAQLREIALLRLEGALTA